MVKTAAIMVYRATAFFGGAIVAQAWNAVAAS